jgi:hypothetical protein
MAPEEIWVEIWRVVVATIAVIYAVIPGWSEGQTRNLEIPGSMLRIAPE